MQKSILCVLMLASSLFSYEVTKLWESQKIMQVPESVILDKDTNQLYVANINGKPTDKDGNGFISIINLDGKVKQLKFAMGLDAPKGMAIQNGRLFVSDINSLKVINLTNGKIENNYLIKDALFLNDVVITNDGTIYVSDYSGSNSVIYKIDDKNIIKWIDSNEFDNERPNGLWLEKGLLVVGTKSGTIFKFDMQTKEKMRYQSKIGSNGIDGILPFNDGGYITSDWAGRVFINDGKKSIKILDRTKEKVNAADIWYDKDSRILYVPTFFDNRIMAYKID